MIENGVRLASVYACSWTLGTPSWTYGDKIEVGLDRPDHEDRAIKPSNLAC